LRRPGFFLSLGLPQKSEKHIKEWHNN